MGLGLAPWYILPSRFHRARARLCFIAVLILMPACVSPSTHAPQHRTPPRVGYLSLASLAESGSRGEAFREALRQFGYIDKDNIIIEYRWADGNRGHLA